MRSTLAENKYINNQSVSFVGSRWLPFMSFTRLSNEGTFDLPGKEISHGKWWYLIFDPNRRRLPQVLPHLFVERLVEIQKPHRWRYLWHKFWQSSLGRSTASVRRKHPWLCGKRIHLYIWIVNFYTLAICNHKRQIMLSLKHVVKETAL